jgi:hypothetical protein
VYSLPSCNGPPSFVVNKSTLFSGDFSQRDNIRAMLGNAKGGLNCANLRENNAKNNLRAYR